jgi:hypothetical protein
MFRKQQRPNDDLSLFLTSDNEDLGSLLGDYGNKPDWWISDDDHPALRKDPSLDFPGLESLIHDSAVTEALCNRIENSKEVIIERMYLEKDSTGLDMGFGMGIDAEIKGKFGLHSGNEKVLLERITIR